MKTPQELIEKIDQVKEGNTSSRMILTLLLN